MNHRGLTGILPLVAGSGSAGAASDGYTREVCSWDGRLRLTPPTLHELGGLRMVVFSERMLPEVMDVFLGGAGAG